MAAQREDGDFHMMNDIEKLMELKLSRFEGTLSDALKEAIDILSEDLCKNCVKERKKSILRDLMKDSRRQEEIIAIARSIKLKAFT
jgi:hypothetical protein